MTITTAVSSMLAFTIGFGLSWFVFGGDPNAKLTFGQSGLPKNCRAIVAANVEGWRLKTFTPVEALDSIERNCGRDGHSWGR